MVGALMGFIKVVLPQWTVPSPTLNALGACHWALYVPLESCDLPATPVVNQQRSMLVHVMTNQASTRRSRVGLWQILI
jgi:hypothetical protein